ncbi:MAG: glycine cleavage system protein GcvH [Actinomycetales bacterium]
MSDVPDTLSYTREHEWVSPPDPSPGSVVMVGITASAAEQLGELVFVELPEVGALVTAGQTCGEVESTKSVSEIYSPVTGTVTEVNAALADEPAIVNGAPYGAGWLFKVEVVEVGELLDAAAYRALVA